MAESQANKQSRKPDHSWVFLLLFIIGAAVLILLDNSPQNKTESNRQATTTIPTLNIDEKEKMNRVNQHLKETAIHLESDRIRRSQEVHAEMQKLQHGTPEVVNNPEVGLTFENNRSMDQLADEFNRSHQLTEEQLTPEQIVQNRLLEMRMQENADQAYREEYARQFIENARAGGWDIRLGPNFEVLSVRKLKPRKPSLFDTSPAQ